jgi:peptidyl-prolyl cis-trans isomerase D
MLDAMRRGVANIFVKGLLALLALAFVLWGVGDYVGGGGGSRESPLANVGDTQISVEEFKRAYQRVVQAEERQKGAPLTPAETKAKLLWKVALDRLAG